MNSNQRDGVVGSNVENERQDSTLENTKPRGEDSTQREAWSDSYDGPRITGEAAKKEKLEIVNSANLHSFIERSASISNSNMEYIRSLDGISFAELSFRQGGQDIELCIVRSDQITAIGYTSYIVLQKLNGNYKLLSIFSSSSLLDLKYEVEEFNREDPMYIPDIFLIGRYRGEIRCKIPIASYSLE